MPPATDLAELRARADAAVRRLSTAHAALDRSARRGRRSYRVSRSALVQMLFFGIADSVPALSTADTPEALAELRSRARTVERIARRRLDEARAAESAFDRARATPDAQREHDVGRIRAVLGAAFIVLPRIARAEASELGRALVADDARFDRDRLAPVAWLQRVACPTRGRAPPYRTALRRSARSPAGAPGRATAVRRGRALGGVAVPAGGNLAAGKLSLVAHTPDPLDAAKPLAGLFVDEWVEIVPAAAKPPASRSTSTSPPHSHRRRSSSRYCRGASRAGA